MAGKKEFSQSHDAVPGRIPPTRFAGGGRQLTADQERRGIAEEMIAISGQGYAGIALSFVNYTQELPFFATAPPILRRAGYRVKDVRLCYFPQSGE